MNAKPDTRDVSIDKMLTAALERALAALVRQIKKERTGR